MFVMRKELILGISAIIVVVALIWIFYPNPTGLEKEEETYGEYYTTFGFYSLCGVGEGKECGIPISCEGDSIDIIGYTKWNDMELRGLVGSGEAKTAFQVIYFDQDSPKNWEEYYDLRSAHYFTGVVIKEAVETDDSSTSAQALKEKLNALGAAEDEPIIVKIRNAQIVGGDMPTNYDCRRGVSLQASYEDITFEKIQ